MHLSLSDFFGKSTMRFLTSAYGQRKARLARERLEAVIAKARWAEEQQRIADMWPSLVTDSADEIRAGQLTLTVIYRPVIDGQKGDRQRWSTTILHPENPNDRPPEAQERAPVQG